MPMPASVLLHGKTGYSTLASRALFFSGSRAPIRCGPAARGYATLRRTPSPGQTRSRPSTVTTSSTSWRAANESRWSPCTLPSRRRFRASL
eukprot:2396855-Alexandrium_andersonii.AAC.1